MAHTQRSLRRVLSFTGRLGRVSWWASIGVAYLLYQIAENAGSTHDIGKLALAMLLCLLIFCLVAAAHCKRLHDLGRTGWWQIVAWVPIVNVGMFAWLGFSKGQAMSNQYGPVPSAWWRAGVGEGSEGSETSDGTDSGDTADEGNR